MKSQQQFVQPKKTIADNDEVQEAEKFLRWNNILKFHIAKYSI